MPSKRRLAFAAPFVVTLGCSHPQPKPPQAEASPDATPTAEAPEPAPEGKGTWTKVEDRWVFSYDTGATATHYPGAELCMFESGMCGPKPGEPISTDIASCNPPPPRSVICPADRPAD